MIPTETRTARESGTALCIDISLLVNLATLDLMWDARYGFIFSRGEPSGAIIPIDDNEGGR
jgi:hypothetical protein